MKKIFSSTLISFFVFALTLVIVTHGLSKCYAQTTADTTAAVQTVRVDVGFLLNDGQRAINVKILHTDPYSDYWKNNAQLLKAIKLKLSEYSQEILSSEWSDKTDSYQMHLTYDVRKQEIL